MAIRFEIEFLCTVLVAEARVKHGIMFIDNYCCFPSCILFHTRGSPKTSFGFSEALLLLQQFSPWYA